MKVLIPLIATLVMLLQNTLYAQGSLSYPELEVVPSAEDRLKEASAIEKENYFEHNWQIFLPASILLLRGVSLSSNIDLDDKNLTLERKKDKEDEIKEKARIGALVGLSWVGVSYYLHQKSTYNESLRKISSLPNKTMADKLARARYAEESMMNKYRVMRKLKWLLAGSTLLFSAIELDNSGSTASSLGYLGILSAGIPLLFDHYWESTFENYEMNKKRIYGPIVQAQVFSDGGSGVLPGLALKYEF